MTDWLKFNDRDDAVSILRQRLSPKALRQAVDRDIERIVMTSERVQGLYRTKLAETDLPEFLVDLYGVDLLQQKELRAELADTLTDEQLTALVAWDGDKPHSRRTAQVEQVASRRWHPGHPTRMLSHISLYLRSTTISRS
jgi:hypothetical protein